MPHHWRLDETLRDLQQFRLLGLRSPLGLSHGRLNGSAADCTTTAMQSRALPFILLTRLAAPNH